MSHRSPRAVSRSLHRALPLRLRLAAAAIASTAAMVSPASATVVTFNTPINVPNTFDGIYINLTTGATGASGASTPGWDWNPYNSGTSLSFFWNGTPASSNSGVAGSTTGPYLDVAPGTVISAASTFAAVTATAATAAFQSNATHRLGFRFFNEATGAINYGVAVISNGGPTGFPMTITSWSFENSGAAFTVPVPVDAIFENSFED